MDVAHQQISLSEEPRFIEQVGVQYFMEFGVGPPHNTQNNLAPNVPEKGVNLPVSPKNKGLMA